MQKDSNEYRKSGKDRQTAKGLNALTYAQEVERKVLDSISRIEMEVSFQTQIIKRIRAIQEALQGQCPTGTLCV